MICLERCGNGAAKNMMPIEKIALRSRLNHFRNLKNYLGKEVGFQEWKNFGYDLHSIFAVPQFVDPKNLDFRLKKQSPAYQIGFKEIDIKNVGVARSL